MIRKFISAGAILLLFNLISIQSSAQDHSIAREWNEEILNAIRNDFARPTVHARNLWHSSILMYDIWAVFDPVAEPYFLGNTVNGFTCPFEGFTTTVDTDEAIHEAISYAIYRLMVNRFINSPGAGEIFTSITSKMQSNSYAVNFTNPNYQNGSPASLGNYIAQKLIEFGLQDGPFQQMDYANQFYMPVNPPLIVEFPGAGILNDPNRWQPLTLDVFIDQSGNEIPFNTPEFLSPEWGTVSPFALSQDDLTVYTRDNNDYWVYHDPGMPPQISLTENNESSDQFKWGFSMVSIWASHLDPTDGVMIDISPAAFGNSPELPDNFADYPDFYNYMEGGDASMGHATNPVTGMPYEPNIVPRGDYARVLAEFWADGPDSETPPGHWFTILNYVNDHPEFKRLYRGQGPEIEELEWDIKSYFLMGSAMHDCAISAWGIKGWYDYLRPISAIRSMADRGQSSDENLPNYDIGGLPLVPGYIELVSATDSLVGENEEHLNKIKLYTWRGPESIEDPASDVAGVGWILAENWWPYQRPSFVTPPFAGYVSGHSTYSRAAADLMSDLTGDPFFPGGMGEFTAKRNEFLVFEDGPSQDIILQWATYRDASDQTSLSRIWGGIHPPADDLPGRLIGIEIADDALELAETYFFKDNDQDGFYNYNDCDDNDPSINPDAIEICDGIDNNCNMGIDENLPLFSYYRDSDGDGFGNLAERLDTCYAQIPIGYSDNPDDCDDLKAEVNPSLVEICDGLDNDCSGIIDDGLPLNRYYIDSDNDGYGNLVTFMDTCLSVAPAGFTDNDVDCNDQDANINPGATEICDGIDNDCTGVSDDNLPLNRYYLDNDNDGYGNPEALLDTCLSTPPVSYVTNALDCNDAINLISPDGIEVCDGIDNDCNGLIDDGLTTFRYYIDNDDDGYGNESIYIDTCLFTAPVNYVDDFTDCNDDDSSINPGMTETADNGIDEDCSGLDLYLESKVFPNPFSDNIYIHFATDQKIIVDVYTIESKRVYHKPMTIMDNNFVLDLKNLSSGMYYLKITNEDDFKLYSSMIIKM